MIHNHNPKFHGHFAMKGDSLTQLPFPFAWSVEVDIKLVC